MKILLSIALITCLSAGSLYAKKPEHAEKVKKHKKQKQHKKKKKHFSSNEKNIINEYYKNLPPGLQKKMKKGGRLPSGWSKKVLVGEPIPKEYIKIATPVSKDLRLKLKLETNTKLLHIANRLVKVEIGTNRLLAEIQF